MAEVCGRDPRALVQMVRMAVENRDLGYTKVKTMLLDRFERDVLADLDYRITWIKTVIAAAPMMGLLGTVLGMMGAFAKLANSDAPEPSELAGTISFALITTAIGLVIAIPLVVAIASVNNKIKQLEDLISVGFSEFLDVFRNSLAKHK
ncbi:MAG: MotA/TolQ/ExbB proton channel family protein [Pirellulaceae bacterium]